jgi:prepilin-type processing-associated H-X9-DG protein
MGGEDPGPITGAPGSWRVFTKLSNVPQPTKMFVLLDENEASINNGWFGIDMAGYPSTPVSDQLFDFPAYYHNNAGGFSFADGHSEIHKWHDGRTMPPINDSAPSIVGASGTVLTPSANNQDVFWIQDHATISN